MLQTVIVISSCKSYSIETLSMDMQSFIFTLCIHSHVGQIKADFWSHEAMEGWLAGGACTWVSHLSADLCYMNPQSVDGAVQPLPHPYASVQDLRLALPEYVLNCPTGRVCHLCGTSNHTKLEKPRAYEQQMNWMYLQESLESQRNWECYILLSIYYD